MSDYNVRLGAYGENLAAAFLARRGYKIIDRNFRTRSGELDLIAAKGDELLFIEVKTRTAVTFGFPELAVDRLKNGRLQKTIGIYLDSRRIQAYPRLDIISVEIDRAAGKARIRWIKDIGNDS